MRMTILVILLVTINWSCNKFYFYKHFRSRNIITVYNINDYATKLNYSKECVQEQFKNYDFPMGVVEKITISSGLLWFQKELNPGKIKPLLKLINDTASYEWGEIGTFNPNSELRFYNKQNELIGLLLLEKNGERQTSSKPYLKTSKWGYLKDSAYILMQELIFSSK